MERRLILSASVVVIVVDNDTECLENTLHSCSD